MDYVVYLRHIVLYGCVAIDPCKTATIASWPAPKSIKEWQPFLGIAKYYHGFIHEYAHTVSATTDVHIYRCM